MPESYHVRLAKEQFVFCSAHFITYGDNVCEPLHGHNYRVAVDLHGPLGDHAYVVDFVATSRTLQAILSELDHRVLLPTEHPTIRVTESPNAPGQQTGEVIATFEDRRWVFPAQDCVLLPIANTTAELLARWIGLALQQRLGAEHAIELGRITVAVDECDGQQGVWDWRPTR